MSQIILQKRTGNVKPGKQSLMSVYCYALNAIITCRAKLKMLKLHTVQMGCNDFHCHDAKSLHTTETTVNDSDREYMIIVQLCAFCPCLSIVCTSVQALVICCGV